MQKRIFLIAFVMCLIIRKFRGEEFPVYSSVLHLVQYGEMEAEFQLKTRGNVSVKINPTSTIPSKTNDSYGRQIVDIGNKTEENLDSSTPVPLIASMYFFDKSTVDVLRQFLSVSGSILGADHRHMIRRYIDDWDSAIHDPRTEAVFATNLDFPDLGTKHITLPKEIESIHKLLRMASRITLELPALLKASPDPQWKEVVDQISAIEVESGRYFTDYDRTETALSVLKLCKMYFENPSDIFPSHDIRRTPLRDVMSVALSDPEGSSLREPLKWLTFARNLFESRLQEGGGEGDPEGTMDSSIRRSYLDLITSILSFKHDYALDAGDYGSSEENLFPSPVSEVSVEEQSRKIFRLRGEISSEKTLPSYEQLCNGLFFKNAREESRLRCRYDDMNDPALTLMPIKVEQLHEHPQVRFFHQVLTDFQIINLQQLALPMHQESLTYKSRYQEKTSRFLTRSSYVKPLKSGVARILKDLDRMTGYLTGLEVTGKNDSEALQVNVYQPGGHFVPHMDSFGSAQSSGGGNPDEVRTDLSEQFPEGDRIATVLYYLNDVNDGGKTVFTKLGLGVTPERGGALLWHSVFDSGEIDERMEHAGCPVISGIKWVANKWVRYNAQFRKRPCPLT